MNKYCFVLMPFDKEFDGIWRIVIKPTIESLGDKCFRADDFFTTGSILSDIINSINNADYIIADLTLVNANVYYEIGYAHALSKKTIIISQDISRLPFDLRHQRVITYEDSAAGAAKLRESLVNYVSNI